MVVFGGGVRLAFVKVVGAKNGVLFVVLAQLGDCEGRVAQWTVLLLLVPLFDALGVEVVSSITGQGRHPVRLLELFQADYALSMLVELGLIKHSGHFGKNCAST